MLMSLLFVLVLFVAPGDYGILIAAGSEMFQCSVSIQFYYTAFYYRLLF